MIDLPPIATPRETAEFLRLGHSTLAKMRLAGNGPAYVKAGRNVVYRREDVLAWMEARLRHSTSEVPWD